MKLAATAIIAILLSSPLAAKDALIKLSAEDAARLNGKSLAITKHQRPSFVAMTPGKASFALLGAGAMIAAGNKIVDENGISDPAILLGEQLASGLKNAFGVLPAAPDATATTLTKPNELAAVIDHKVMLLVVIGKAPFPVLAKHFVFTAPKIARFIEQHSAPWIAKVYRPSAIDLEKNKEAPGSVSLWYPKNKRKVK